MTSSAAKPPAPEALAEQQNRWIPAAYSLTGRLETPDGLTSPENTRTQELRVRALELDAMHVRVRRGAGLPRRPRHDRARPREEAVSTPSPHTSEPRNEKIPQTVLVARFSDSVELS